MTMPAFSKQLNYCDFKDTSGNACGETCGSEHYCYWHQNDLIKQDNDLKEKLEERAQAHQEMRYFKLRNTDLSNINLVNKGQKKGYSMTHTDLYHSNLQNAHLFGIDLSFSSLMKADL